MDLIISVALFPLSLISSKLSFSIFPEIVPSLIFIIRLEKLSTVIFESSREILFLFSNAQGLIVMIANRAVWVKKAIYMY